MPEIIQVQVDLVVPEPETVTTAEKLPIKENISKMSKRERRAYEQKRRET